MAIAAHASSDVCALVSCDRPSSDGAPRNLMRASQASARRTVSVGRRGRY